MMIKAAHYKRVQQLEDTRAYYSERGEYVDEDESKEDEMIQYYIRTLTNMGYNSNDIDDALSAAVENYSIHEVSLDFLIQEVLEREKQRRQQSKRKSKPSISEETAGNAQSPYTSNDYLPDGFESDPYYNYRQYCQRLARSLEEYRQSNPDDAGASKDDHNEIDAKFVMAQNVMDNFSKGSLVKVVHYSVHSSLAGDTSSTVVNYLQWATQMLELLGDVEAAYHYDQLPSETRVPFDHVSREINLQQYCQHLCSTNQSVFRKDFRRNIVIWRK